MRDCWAVNMERSVDTISVKRSHLTLSDDVTRFCSVLRFTETNISINQFIFVYIALSNSQMVHKVFSKVKHDKGSINGA